MAIPLLVGLAKIAGLMAAGAAGTAVATRLEKDLDETRVPVMGPHPQSVRPMGRGGNEVSLGAPEVPTRRRTPEEVLAGEKRAADLDRRFVAQKAYEEMDRNGIPRERVYRAIQEKTGVASPGEAKQLFEERLASAHREGQFPEWSSEAVGSDPSSLWDPVNMLSGVLSGGVIKGSSVYGPLKDGLAGVGQLLSRVGAEAVQEGAVNAAGSLSYPLAERLRARGEYNPFTGGRDTPAWAEAAASALPLLTSLGASRAGAWGGRSLFRGSSTPPPKVGATERLPGASYGGEHDLEVKHLEEGVRMRPLDEKGNPLQAVPEGPPGQDVKVTKERRKFDLSFFGVPPYKERTPGQMLQDKANLGDLDFSDHALLKMLGEGDVDDLTRLVRRRVAKGLEGYFFDAVRSLTREDSPARARLEGGVSVVDPSATGGVRAEQVRVRDMALRRAHASLIDGILQEFDEMPFSPRVSPDDPLGNLFLDSVLRHEREGWHGPIRRGEVTPSEEALAKGHEEARRQLQGILKDQVSRSDEFGRMAPGRGRVADLRDFRRKLFDSPEGQDHLKSVLIPALVERARRQGPDTIPLDHVTGALRKEIFKGALPEWLTRKQGGVSELDRIVRTEENRLDRQLEIPEYGMPPRVGDAPHVPGEKRRQGWDRKEAEAARRYRVSAYNADLIADALRGVDPKNLTPEQRGNPVIRKALEARSRGMGDKAGAKVRLENALEARTRQDESVPRYYDLTPEEIAARSQSIATEDAGGDAKAAADDLARYRAAVEAKKGNRESPSDYYDKAREQELAKEYGKADRELNARMKRALAMEDPQRRAEAVEGVKEARERVRKYYEKASNRLQRDAATQAKIQTALDNGTAPEPIVRLTENLEKWKADKREKLAAALAGETDNNQRALWIRQANDSFLRADKAVMEKRLRLWWENTPRKEPTKVPPAKKSPATPPPPPGGEPLRPPLRKDGYLDAPDEQVVRDLESGLPGGRKWDLQFFAGKKSPHPAIEKLTRFLVDPDAGKDSSYVDARKMGDLQVTNTHRAFEARAAHVEKAMKSEGVDWKAVEAHLEKGTPLSPAMEKAVGPLKSLLEETTDDLMREGLLDPAKVQALRSGGKVHLRRLYEAFEAPFTFRPDPVRVEAAVAGIMKDQNIPRVEAAKKVSELLEYASFERFGRKKDGQTTGVPALTSFQELYKRKDVPDYLRALLGEVQEPKMRVFRTLVDAQRDLANMKVFKALRQSGLVELSPKEGYAEVSTSIRKKGDLRGLGVREGLGIPSVERVFVPKAIARDLNGSDLGNKEIVEAGKILMSVWKAGKVVFDPAVHATNLLGNGLMSLIGGVPVRHQAKEFLRSVREVRNGWLGNESPMFKLAKEHGVLGKGFISKDADMLYHDVMTASRARGGGPLLTYAIALRKGVEKAGGRKAGEVYQAIEDAQRFTLFSYVMRNGIPAPTVGKGASLPGRRQQVTAKEAAAWVDRYLFDYDKVPGAVKVARNSFLPFVSFPYLAAKALAKTAGRNPERLAGAFLLATGIQEAAKLGGVDLDITRIIPFGNLVMGDEEGVGGFARPSGPYAAAVEVARNRKFFDGKPVVERGENPLVASAKHLGKTMLPTPLSQGVGNIARAARGDGARPIGSTLLKTLTGIDAKVMDEGQVRREKDRIEKAEFAIRERCREETKRLGSEEARERRDRALRKLAAQKERLREFAY